MESLQNKSNKELIQEIEILQSRLEALEKKNSNLLSTHDSLRKNERRFRSAFEDSGVGMVLADPEGRYVKVNKAMTTILGYSEEEFLSMTPSDITFPGDVDQKNERVQKLYSGEIDSVKLEKRYVHRDGHTIWGSVVISSIKDDSGKVIYTLGQLQGITDRKRAEEALRESEEKYRTIIENSGEAILLTKPDGRILSANDSACRLFDRSEKEICYMGRDKLVDTSDPRLSALIEERNRTGRTRGKLRLIRKDGSKFEGELSSIVFKDTDGDYRTSMTIRDLTKQIHDEEKIRRYESIVSCSTDLMALVDDNFRYLAVNESYCNAFNKASSDIVGHTVAEVVGEEMFQKIIKPDAERCLKGEKVNCQEWIHFPAYTKMFIDINYYPYFDDDNNIAGFVVNARDITASKQAEQALQESENRFKLLYENTPLSYQSLDENARLLDVNPTWLATVGYTREEVIGRHFGDFMTAESAELIKERFPDFITAGEMHGYQFEMVKKDGSHFFVSYDGKIGYDEVGHFKQTHCIFTDITERKLAEQALRESEEKFRTIFNESPIGIELYKADGTQLTANKASLNMFEIPDASEIQTFNLFDGVSLDDEKKERLRNGEPVHYQSTYNFEKVKELQLYKTDGKGIAYFDYIITPLLNLDNQTIQGYLLQVQNITEHKQMEEALRASELKFRQIFEESPIAIEYFNLDGSFSDCNKAALKLFGIPDKSELLEYNIFNSPQVYKEVKQHFRESKPLRYEKWVDFKKIKEDNIYNTNREDKIYVNINSLPIITGSENEVVGFLVQIQDLTERKIAENALREGERKLNTLVNNLPGMAYRCLNDEYYTMKFLSKGCEEITGYKVSELFNNEGIAFSDLIHPDDKKYIAAEIFRSLNNGEQFELNYRIITKSGTLKWVWERGQQVIDEYKNETFLEGIIEDITETIESKEKLQESEKKYRSMFENMLNGFAYHKIITDEHGQPIDYIFLEANNGFEKLTGLKKEDIIGRKVTEVLPGIESNSGGWIEKYGHVALTGDEIQFEDYSTELNKWYSVYAYSPHKDYFVTLFEEITERKKAEEEIKKLSYAVEQSPVVVLITDVRGNIEYVNRSFVELTGYSAEEVIGQNPRILKSGETPSEEYSSLWKTVLNGGEWSGEFHNKKKNGELYWEFARISGIKDKDGKIIHLVAFKEDITDRKLAEDALVESEARWRSLTENSADYIMLLDTGTNIQFVNRGGPELSKKELVGKNAYNFIPKPFHNAAKICFDKVLSTGESASFETEYHAENDRLEYFSVRVGPVIKSGKVVALVLGATDITKRKSIENSLKNSYMRLRSLAERLQAVREEERAVVAREIHDDLGQSLTAIKMDISWLKKNKDVDDSTRIQKFDTILNLTDSTIQSVKKIASDLRPGVLDDLGLIPAIEWQTDEFESRYGIKCNLYINKKDVTLEDSVSIAVFRIYQETLTNIARHSKATRVDIHLDFHENRKLFIEIHDNGIGIKNETAKSQKSFGILGMRERVSLLKGGMEIIGKPAKGTMVRVVIPY